MIHSIGLKLLFVIGSLTLVQPAFAVKPGEEVNPNGFPSGEHYNLNIHGKRLDFNCPGIELGEFGQPVYGKSLFVPEDGQGIQVIMESGSAKGKKAALITDLQVTDPCTADFDGDAAVLRLPPNEKGYRVYGRALGKPTDEPSMQVMPDLIAVEDELGNDLLYLGLITSNGFESTSATFIRKKGKSKAVDITGLFEWSGEVCYLTSMLCDPIEECTPQLLCCEDVDGDGVFETCEPKVDDVCAFGIETEAFCKSYEAEWVFNIGDFVRYLWDVENRGLKLVNVRFYPVK